nr:hypothetical protein GW17_00009362 [Ipomoea trifida]
MAETKAAVKLGFLVSAAAAALTMPGGSGGFGEWNGGGCGVCACVAMGLVRSRVMVGTGAKVDIVGRKFAGRASRFAGRTPPSALRAAPESSIVAAADVVDAIGLATGGSGWLCSPS